MHIGSHLYHPPTKKHTFQGHNIMHEDDCLHVLIDISTYLYTYRKRPKFQNILERKFSNCFGQLLYIYQKNLKHEIG